MVSLRFVPIRGCGFWIVSACVVGLMVGEFVFDCDCTCEGFNWIVFDNQPRTGLYAVTPCNGGAIFDCWF